MAAIGLGNGIVLAETKWNSYLYLPADDLITPHISFSGVFEPVLSRYIVKVLKPGGTFIDAGAHVGYFTVLAAVIVGSTGKVLAFEPNPKVADFLRRNIIVNYLREQTEIYQEAVWSHAETLSFYAAKRLSCNSSVGRRVDGYEDDWMDEIETLQVAAQDLGTHIRRLGRVDFIKMDVEGSEYRAFLGMLNCLHEGLVDRIAFEWAPTMLKDDTEPLVNLLQDLESAGLYNYYISTQNDYSTMICASDLERCTFINTVVAERKAIPHIS